MSKYDNQNMPPHLAPPTLERLQSAELAWLNEKVPPEDIKKAFGFLWFSRVVEFDTAEEWEYLAKAMQDGWPIVRNHWTHVERLLTKPLDGESRGRAVAAVRAWLSTVPDEDIRTRPRLLGVLAALGERNALAQLLRLLAEGGDGPASFQTDLGPFALQFIARRVAPIRDPQALDVQLRALRRAVAGWQFDDTGSGDYTVRRIVALIHSRGAADRATALLRVKGWNLQSLPSHVRWAFGERPTRDELLTLRPEYYGRLLSLVEWDAQDYQEVLPELRADPEKHCTALAALGDESAAESIGRMMAQSARGLRRDAVGLYRARWAVERLGNAAAVEPLYPVIEFITSNQFERLAVTIGRVEDPARLDRLIGLIERSNTIVGDQPRHGTYKPHAALALWITLGRKR